MRKAAENTKISCSITIKYVHSFLLFYSTPFSPSLSTHWLTYSIILNRGFQDLLYRPLLCNSQFESPTYTKIMRNKPQINIENMNNSSSTNPHPHQPLPNPLTAVPCMDHILSLTKLPPKQLQFYMRGLGRIQIVQSKQANKNIWHLEGTSGTGKKSK